MTFSGFEPENGFRPLKKRVFIDEIGYFNNLSGF